MCVSAGLCVHYAHAAALGGQKKVLDSLEPEFYPVWMLGAGPEFSEVSKCSSLLNGLSSLPVDF